MEILRLHPLTQLELTNISETFLERLFSNGFAITQVERLGNDLIKRVLGGGYPPALARATEGRRISWYRSYLDTIIQRDLRDLTQVSSLEILPRLLDAAATQTACLFNVSALAAPFQLSRLVKTPKLHLGDSGLAAALLDLDYETVLKDRGRLGRVLRLGHQISAVCESSSKRLVTNLYVVSFCMMVKTCCRLANDCRQCH